MIKYSLLVFYIILVSTLTAQQPPELNLSKKNNQKNQQIVSGDNIDIIYAAFHWHINPSRKYIKGKVSTIFRATKENTDEIILDLSNNLYVDSIVFRNKRIEFSHAFDFLHISLSNALIINEIDTIEIHYQGVPNDPQNSFSQSYHNNIPVIWTLSEPFGAKEWWPCKQNLNDKIDSTDVFVYTPQQYRAASNGILVSENIEGDTRINHWKHRHPIESYLIAIAVTNYVVYEELIELDDYSFPVINYVYPEDLEEVKTKTAALIPVFELFDSLFMAYPYRDEKYGHAQFSWGGGMEHQTMSFVGNFSFGLLAHELAHQWFGDYITCGSWADIWLNEGFATYCEGLTYENGLGNIPFNGWIEYHADRAMKMPNGVLFVNDTTSVSRIFSGNLSYSKGAMLLHTLRGQIGDDAFFGAIRNYLNDSILSNGYAQTDDLIWHFENAADTTLTGFFNDWLYSGGYPTYAMFWEQKSSGDFVFNLNQRHSGNQNVFFELNVPVYFEGDNADTLIYFRHAYSGQEFTFSPGFEVENIVFDPNNIILTNQPKIINRNDVAYDPGIKLFPNPVKSDVSVLLHKPLQFNEISIYNSEGKIIKTFENNEYKRFYMFDLEEIPTGFYYMVFKMDNDNVVKKLAKM